MKNLVRLLVAASLACLAGCGGGGGGAVAPPPVPAIRTQAYVATACHEDAESVSLRQTLRILNGDHAPVTVKDIPSFGPLPPLGACAAYGQFRYGNASSLFGAFQRLGVSPDASTVVFEINFDLTLLANLGVPNPLTPAEQGFFRIRADGSGLRKLGPPSRAAASNLVGTPSPTGGFYSYYETYLGFSPDSRTITFTDLGPGSDTEDSIQIFTMDVATGIRHQLTQLPGEAPDFEGNPALPVAVLPAFVDNQTIVFVSRTNADGNNPGGVPRLFTVRRDGSGLMVVPPPAALPGSVTVPVFSITTPVGGSGLWTFPVPGTPVNPVPGFASSVTELFLFDGANLLQLTNFGRSETGFGVTGTVLGEHVFFVASADPFQTNRSENCQIFSINRLGSDLHQLTQFGGAPHSDVGCTSVPGAGCDVGSQLFNANQATGDLVFDSTCDPFGTNPNGQQLFAMRQDGTGLRQLTSLSGVVTAPDGSVDVELPGPTAPAF
jgi:hypothetical protein